MKNAVILTGLAAMSVASPANAHNYCSNMPKAYDVFKNYVVNITTVNDSMGSGVVINRKGDILTSAHVVLETKDKEFMVRDIHGETYRYKFGVSGDMSSVAVITPSLKKEHPLSFTKINYRESVYAGEEIFSIGHPLGLNFSFAHGYIGFPSRTIGQSNFVQLSMPVQRGFSGAPVFNCRGRVIGVVYGFAAESDSLGLASSLSETEGIVFNGK